MSWQPHLDMLLVTDDRVSQGAIYGLDGSQYVASPSFEICSVEVQNIIAGFNGRSLIERSGFGVAGVKYHVFHGNSDVISGATPLGGIIYTAMTTQVLLIAVYKVGLHHASCGK